jgi:DNA-binding beta-propeller fold protein YncE
MHDEWVNSGRIRPRSGSKETPMFRPTRRALAIAASVTIAGAAFAGFARAGGEAPETTGALPCAKDSSTKVVLPNGWCIRPAGTQIDVLRDPFGLATTADGKKVLVSSSGGGVQGLTVINNTTLTGTPQPAANLFMGMAALPSGKIYASGGNANRVFRFRMHVVTATNKDATELEPFPVNGGLDAFGHATGVTAPTEDGIKVSGYPGPMSLDGSLLYVGGTLGEPTGTGTDACPGGAPACARVSVIDTNTDSVIRRIPVGEDAIAMAVDAAHRRLYVANWADEAGRGNGVGTVSVIDITNPGAAAEIASVPVGHHPTAIQLSADKSKLFVANTNDDTISVIDTAGAVPTVLATHSVSPLPGAPTATDVGAHPDAFTLSPGGDSLFVALAGMNAVEVLDGKTGGRISGQPVYIPTGWYPSALTTTKTATGYRLWVANAKGNGPGIGHNGTVFFDGTTTDGTVSAIDLPFSATDATKWTDTVRQNDKLDAISTDPCAPSTAVRVSEVLCPPSGQTSPVKHVIYIVTENKTFDSYFGDMSPTTYNANAGFTLFPRANTPNHHALADRFSLGDNFFSDAEVSVTGHSFTSGAIATDHNEKTWPADYDEGVRGNHGNGDPLRPNASGAPGKAIGDAESKLNDPSGGYVFEAFKRAGAVAPAQAGPGKLSMAIYGEHTAAASGNTLDAYKAPGWKDGDIRYFDTCRAMQFITGSAPDGPSPAFTAGASYGTVAADDCDGRSLPPQFTLKQWTDTFKATGQDTMPNFIYMSLPVNHTVATNVGSPTPESMVADNDFAIGSIVDALSKSPFWASSVVMQTEDDTQATGDHVSPLRDYLLAAGPWTQPGANHQWGSMPSMLRTVEQLFGVQPVSLYDRLAMPMHQAFRGSLSETPNLAPFNVVPELVPFGVNEPGVVGAEASAAMNFDTWDLIDEATMNAVLKAYMKHEPLQLPTR